MAMIIMCVLASRSAAADVDARALAAGIEQRIDHCGNLKFAYTVRADGRTSLEATPGRRVVMLPAGDHVESNDVFKIMDSNRPDVSVPWRYWERRVRGSNGEWILDRFVGFDGAQRRQFLRKETGEGRWHQGNIVPFDDPYSYEPNLFESVFLADINGLPQRADPTHAVSHELGNHLRVVARKEVQGRVVYSLEGRNDRYALDYKLDVIGSPDFLILRWDVKGAKDGKPYFLKEVRGLKEFEGRAYPAAGLYRQWAMGELPDINYEFTVTSIERLPESARDQWFPDWPPGTSVGDQVNNKAFDVPQDRGTLDEARLAELGGLAAGSSWRRNLFFLIANVCGIVLLIFAIRRFRKRARESPNR